MENNFITVKEFSEKYSMPVPTIYQLIRSRKIPFYKPTKKIFFLESDIKSFFLKSRVEALDEKLIELNTIQKLKDRMKI